MVFSNLVNHNSRPTIYIDLPLHVCEPPWGMQKAYMTSHVTMVGLRPVPPSRPALEFEIILVLVQTLFTSPHIISANCRCRANVTCIYFIGFFICVCRSYEVTQHDVARGAETRTEDPHADGGLQKACG